MHNDMTGKLGFLPLVCLALVLGGCAASGPRLGEGRHRYEWVSDWLVVPGGGELGNTHGEIVVDSEGFIHLNTDTEQAIMVFAPDGTHVRSLGKPFANGLHGMCLVREGRRDVLYLAHFNRHEVVKMNLAGDIMLRIGWPQASGLYESEDQFRPTDVAVAPDGRIFVADGYGLHYVHRYDAVGNYLGSFGGPGSSPGQFQTPHGIHVDTRKDVPVVIVADRENHRLQLFDLEGGFRGMVIGMFRRPCKIQQRGTDLVVPDLAGRVTILDADNRVVTQLGDNPDPTLWAVNGVPREKWKDGEFLAPHSAAWDANGNLYVMDWNALGRITKLRRL